MHGSDTAAPRRLPFTETSVARAPRTLASELPIAFEYNGVAYAVMLGTPGDLEDFAIGFTLSEGLVEDVDEIVEIVPAEVEKGTILRISLAEHRASPIRERVRLRLVEGSCGLCGLDSIEQVLRPMPRLEAQPRIDASAIASALAQFRDYQPMGQATGAMHAAAFCDPSGSIMAAREDVGRHNALDKLVGHMAKMAIDPSSGFVLLSARCSCELVEKTVRAGVPALVTISAASDLAVERATAADLTLVSLARDDGALIMNDPFGVFPL